MTKLCGDKQCNRAGQRLKLSEFPYNEKTKTKRHSYCRKCTNRRQAESRARIKAANAERMKYELERKPMVLSEAQDPFVKVYWAIVGGCRTREQLKSKTLLSYSAIGDALVELVYECKVVKIEDRRFVLVNSERAAA